jgi:hypothetical protein
MRSLLEQRSRNSLERQRELRRTTGFAGELHEVGHAVAWELQKRGYTHSTAAYAGQLAAAGPEWNWQGNRRIAEWMRRTDRTARRARAVLERDGLVRSFLLLPGEMVAGQRAPVKRPQVVRDVSALHRLANVRTSERRARPHARTSNGGAGAQSPPRPGSPVSSTTSVAHVAKPITAADLDELARLNPEFASYFTTMAAAARRPPSPVGPVPPAPSPSQIDEWDRETERQERERRAELETELPEDDP